MGPEFVINKMKAINSHVGSWAPMAEQKAVAKYLINEPAVNSYLTNIKNEISYRLTHLHQGFQQLKTEGFSVDSIEPQAAIYLTVQINLVGKKTADGKQLDNQAAVTEYVLSEAKLALVPFGYFGSDRENNWYRISVGCCKKEDIENVINSLRKALTALS
jgi:aspartate aminotransferase